MNSRLLTRSQEMWAAVALVLLGLTFSSPLQAADTMADPSGETASEAAYSKPALDLYRRHTLPAYALPNYRPDLYRAWRWSIVPVAASQAFDAASSWNMRELNPALADGAGRFGVRSVALKLGAAGALLGIEYLLIKRHPAAARVLAKLNWTSAAVTAGFAAHNYSLR